MKGGARWTLLFLLLLVPLLVIAQDEPTEEEEDETTTSSSNETTETTSEASNTEENTTKPIEASNTEENTTKPGDRVTESVTQTEGSTTLVTDGSKTTLEGGGGSTTTERGTTDVGEVGGGGNVTEGVTEANATVTEAVDSNTASGNDTEVTEDGGGLTTTDNDETTSTTTTKETTTLAPTITTGPQCGENALADKEVCVCQPGWIRDPADPSSTSCPCLDLCHAPGGMTCPAGSQCFHLTCNFVSCRCQKNRFYDPVSKTCVDSCQYFGDPVCGLGSDRICQVSTKADVGYTCPCASGYTLQNDTCVDEDECEGSQPCGANEECKNLVGSYVCSCRTGFLRVGDGSCANVNECLNPALHTCEHLCIDENPGYTCNCLEGYTMNDTLNRCKLKNESTSCECGDPGKSICYQPPDGDVQCHPKPGYLLVNGSYVDATECNNSSDQWCGLNGVCVEGTGQSYCKCQTGFVNDTLNNGHCVEIKCSPGTVLSGSQCVDPCSLVTCTSPMRCVVENDGSGQCLCGTECQGLLNQHSNTSIYNGAMVISALAGGSGEVAGQVTATLSAIFDKDNVEVMDVREQKKRKRRATEALVTLLVEFVVMTDQPNMTQEVGRLIKDQCLNISNNNNKNSSGTNCVLPGGIVVKTDSINVEVKDPCSSNPCPSDLFQCTVRSDVSGRFLCNCKIGYARVEVLGTPGFCQDIDECNGTKAVCEEDKECINTPGSFTCRSEKRGPFGSKNMLELVIVVSILLAIAILIVLGLGYMLCKKSHRVRELVPMTERSPGFENHAFHK